MAATSSPENIVVRSDARGVGPAGVTTPACVTLSHSKRVLLKRDTPNVSNALDV